MKQAQAMTAADAPSCWNYQHIIDSRSPAEFALDHVPGAVNWPVLDSAQRESVGTLYQREGSFKAKLAGATLVARNIASLIEDRATSIDPHARLLVYCWRGGNRSGALSTVLARIGFRTDVLEGGYKAFRRWVIEDTARRAQGLKFCIVAGRTGSAKTDLLHLLAQEGEQVIDLEALARHRGSLLGATPDSPQPSQRAFETSLWFQLARCQPGRLVWLESESRKIGQIQIPESIIERMRSSPHYQLEVESKVRSKYLLDHYQHWIREPERLQAITLKLRPFLSSEAYAALEQSLSQQRLEEFVSLLLKHHYDPLYDRSIAKNFRSEKRRIALTALDGASLQDAVRQIREQHRDSAQVPEVGSFTAAA